MPQTRSQRAANNAAEEQRNPPANAHVPNARSSARLQEQRNNAPADDVNAHAPSDEQLRNPAFLEIFIAQAGREVLKHIIYDRNKIRLNGNRARVKDATLKNLMRFLYDESQYENATEGDVRRYQISQLKGFARSRSHHYQPEYVNRDVFAEKLIREHFRGDESDEEEEKKKDDESNGVSLDMDDGGDDDPLGAVESGDDESGVETETEDEKKADDSAAEKGNDIGGDALATSNKGGKEPTPTKLPEGEVSPNEESQTPTKPEGGLASPNEERGRGVPLEPDGRSPSRRGSSINSDDEGKGTKPSNLRATSKGTTKSTHSTLSTPKEGDVRAASIAPPPFVNSDDDDDSKGDQSSQLRTTSSAKRKGLVTPAEKVSSFHESTTGDQLTSDLDDFNNGNGKTKRVAFKSPGDEEKAEAATETYVELEVLKLRKEVAEKEEKAAVQQEKAAAQQEKAFGFIINRLEGHDQRFEGHDQLIAETKEGVAENRKVIGKHGQKIAKLQEGHTELEKLYKSAIEEAKQEVKQQAEQSAKKYSKKYSKQISEGQPLSPDPTDNAIGALTGTTLFPNAAPPATSASKSDSLPVAAAGESESIDDLKVVVSNDDDANAEDGAKDEDGGEYQCDVASACDELSGIDLAELTPGEASKFIPTIWRVLQDSGDDNQLQIALGALEQVLSIGRKNEGVAYLVFLEEIFRDHRGVLEEILDRLEEFHDATSEKVRDLAESIMSTYFRSDTAENEGTTESKDEAEDELPALANESDDVSKQPPIAEGVKLYVKEGQWKPIILGKSTEKRGSLSIEGNTLTFRFHREEKFKLQCVYGGDILIPAVGRFVFGAQACSLDGRNTIEAEKFYQVEVNEKYHYDVLVALQKAVKHSALDSPE